MSFIESHLHPSSIFTCTYSHSLPILSLSVCFYVATKSRNILGSEYIELHLNKNDGWVVRFWFAGYDYVSVFVVALHVQFYFSSERNSCKLKVNEERYEKVSKIRDDTSKWMQMRRLANNVHKSSSSRKLQLKWAKIFKYTLNDVQNFWRGGGKWA